MMITIVTVRPRRWNSQTSFFSSIIIIISIIIVTAAPATAQCPSFVTVPLSTDGGATIVSELRFDFGGSLFGTALAGAHAMGVSRLRDEDGDCAATIGNTRNASDAAGVLCAAATIAMEARAAFRAAPNCLEDRSPSSPSSSSSSSSSLLPLFEGALDVLQVGAHIGDSHDVTAQPLDPLFAWLRHAAPAWVRALLVEPVRASFEALVANYAGAAAQLHYLHAAVDVTAGRRSIFVPSRCDDNYAEDPRRSDDEQRRQKGELVVDNAQLAIRQGKEEGHYCIERDQYSREHGSLIGSLQASHIEEHLWPFMHNAFHPERLLRRIPVPAVDWAAILAMHSCHAIGLLLIDAEGVDCRLLDSFPFHAVRPNVIVFEHAHCDGTGSHQPRGDSSSSSSTAARRHDHHRPAFERTRALLLAHGYRQVASDAGATLGDSMDATFYRE